MTLGVKVDVIQAGDGKTFPTRGDIVIIHYIGWDEKWKEFDNSYHRGETFETEIGTGKVISGWDEGIARMSKGEKARLTIRPDLAYGSKGYPPMIGPNSTLYFEILLVDVIRRACFSDTAPALRR